MLMRTTTTWLLLVALCAAAAAAAATKPSNRSPYRGVERLLEEEEEEVEVHLDDFEEDFEECEHACETCEERHCRNLWLEKPRGRHLTIAELTWTQNVCIVLLLALLTLFARCYYAALGIAKNYELRHHEDLRQVERGKSEAILLDAERERARPKVFGTDCRASDEHSTKAHAVLHRAFAFYATAPPHHKEESPAHETLENVLGGVPSRHYYQGLLRSFSAELMGLGFVSIFVWVAEIGGFFKSASVGENGRWGPQTPEQAKITFEDVHFAVFSGVLVYFFFLFQAIRHACSRFDCFLSTEWDLASNRHPLGPNDDPNVRGRRCRVKFAKDTENFFPGLRASFIEWMRDHVDDLDQFGIASPNLDRRIFEAAGDDFPFAVYLRLSLDNLVEHLLEVQNSTWCAIIAIYAIEGVLARLAELDVPVVSLGVATTFNFAIAATIAVARWELATFVADHTKVGHSGTREHWWLKQTPRVIQTATLYVVIQFARFCVDTIVDAKNQMQRYRGQTSFNGWVALQISNVIVHYVLVMHLFPEITVQLAIPPVIGSKSIDLVARVCLLYASLTHRLRLRLHEGRDAPNPPATSKAPFPDDQDDASCCAALNPDDTGAAAAA